MVVSVKQSIWTTNYLSVSIGYNSVRSSETDTVISLGEEFAEVKSNKQAATGLAERRTPLELIKARGQLELAFQREGG